MDVGMFFKRFIDFLKPGKHRRPKQNYMARILSDREIKKLLKDVIIGADESLISPNGIELRLGAEVRFQSTNEKKPIAKGHFLVVHPGESVLIVSLEKLDFKKETIHKHFPNAMLMALITPTTTMMREGMLQCSTKVHAGFFGELNWGFRNSSCRDFIIQQGEPLFNLTLLLLQGEEVPEVPYGEKRADKYQNTSGIMVSQRRLPAEIPKDQMVDSSFHKLDPKIQLREAGHPFSYIGTELMQLQGKFDLVSSDVRALEGKIDAVLSALQLKSLTSTVAAMVMLLGIVLTIVTTESAVKFLRFNGSWIGLLLIIGAGVFLFLALRRTKK
jgi:deoxycytidine triphosphate deaminase